MLIMCHKLYEEKKASILQTTLDNLLFKKKIIFQVSNVLNDRINFTIFHFYTFM